jgi:sugar-specific transcriptional regulator TrmB
MPLDTSTAAALARLPLSVNEQAVYQTCLEQGPQTILELTGLTGIKRTTLYGVTEDLVAKKLLSSYKLKSHRVFFAERAAALERFMDGELATLTSQREALKANLPLFAMAEADGILKPALQLHSGKAAVRNAYENLLQKGLAEVLFVCEAGSLEQALGEESLRELVKRRLKLDIQTRGIYADVPTTEPTRGRHKTNPEVRLAPPTFRAPMYTGVFGDTVLLISSAGETTGVQITSRDYVATVRSWFELLWDASFPS